jgi:hypothetical protein
VWLRQEVQALLHRSAAPSQLELSADQDAVRGRLTMYLLHRCMYLLHRCMYLLHRRMYLLHRRMYLLHRCMYLLRRCMYLLHRCMYLLRRCMYLLHRRMYLPHRRLYLLHRCMYRRHRGMYLPHRQRRRQVRRRGFRNDCLSFRLPLPYEPWTRPPSDAVTLRETWSLGQQSRTPWRLRTVAT